MTNNILVVSIKLIKNSLENNLLGGQFICLIICFVYKKGRIEKGEILRGREDAGKGLGAPITNLSKLSTKWHKPPFFFL